ncbi:hypothetical protein ACOI22_15665 [Glaciecola sp. 2405UD65-10]|uniref:hypothetical protein n=1 Tax=Glaciecola sp. 2405UD65-10 TaxID=3397244 RepID=UPI003B59C6B5
MAHSFLKFLLTLLTLLALCGSNKVMSADAKKPEAIVWGGGGAYTSVQEYKGDLYLSSDVAGVWKQVSGSWQPYVKGLSNYNVTSLAIFNNLLFAITTNELLYSNGDGNWITANISLNTYRGVTDSPYAISGDGSLLCIAGRKAHIDCINKQLEHNRINTQGEVITGVWFSNTANQQLHYYSGNKLFLLDVSTQKSKLLHTFNNKVVSMFEVNSRKLLATSKSVFELNNLDAPIYKVHFSKIITAFAAKIDSQNRVFLSLGKNKWNTSLRQYTFVDEEFSDELKIKPSFDTTLPHRSTQASLTKFLGINQAFGSIYLTDYWGVFELSLGAKADLLEVSNNAYNLVSTDLVIGNEHIYISAMDTGVFKIAKQADENGNREIEAISSKHVKGHAWSMLYANNTLNAVIAPWNSANDHLFTYSELDNTSQSTALNSYKSRKARGTFWGQAYARKLAYFHGIVSFRDGHNGGLLLYEADEKESFSFGEFNKVYKAVEEFKGKLYAATCEWPATVMVFGANAEAEYTIRLPKSFCAYTSYKHKDDLYFLGSEKKRSVIYKLKGRRVRKVFSTDVGSAFYAMGINPYNNDQIIAATITFSNKATSGIFVSNDGGNNFIDHSCLLTHKNGVVAVKLDETDSTAYILHKVGGLIQVPLETLFDGNSC